MKETRRQAAKPAGRRVNRIPRTTEKKGLREKEGQHQRTEKNGMDGTENGRTPGLRERQTVAATPGLKVRRAETKDIPRIMELLVQVCNVHHDGRPDIFRRDATKYTPAELEILIADDTRPIFVGVDGGDRVLGYGFCVVTETEGTHALQAMRSLYIDDLCVDENLRGGGIGRRIYEYIVDYARGIGCYHLTLNVWACNPSAMAFYEARGLKMLKKEMEVIL